MAGRPLTSRWPGTLLTNRHRSVLRAAEARYGVASLRPRSRYGAARREVALAAFDDPALRKVLIELKTRLEVVIDDVSRDVVISSAFRPPGARAMTGGFRALPRRAPGPADCAAHPLRPARGVEAADLREPGGVARRPCCAAAVAFAAAGVWSAYRRLQGDGCKGEPGETLTDIVALVRFALGQRRDLAPAVFRHGRSFQPMARARGRAGRDYSEEQLGWLEAIRDYLAANVEVTTGDIQDSFAAKGGGFVGMRRGFRLAAADDLSKSLQDALVA